MQNMGKIFDAALYMTPVSLLIGHPSQDVTVGTSYMLFVMDK